MRTAVAALVLGATACADGGARVPDARPDAADAALTVDVEHDAPEAADPNTCPSFMITFCSWLDNCAALDDWTIVGADSTLTSDTCLAKLVAEDGFTVLDSPDPSWRFGGCNRPVLYDFTECLVALQRHECSWSRTEDVVAIMARCRPFEFPIGP